MALYQAASITGRTFTVKVFFDGFSSDGTYHPNPRPADGNYHNVYVHVSPAVVVDADDFANHFVPDMMGSWDHVTSTPGATVLSGYDEGSVFSLSEAVRYMQEAAQRMVDEFDSIEDGSYLQDETLTTTPLDL